MRDQERQSAISPGGRGGGGLRLKTRTGDTSLLGGGGIWAILP